MIRRVLLQLLLLSPAFALATFVLGWWAVPVLAGLWGSMARREKYAELLAAAAAGGGWSLLLIWTATQGPVGELARRAAGVMGISGLALVGMTLAFSMMLAWSAAVVGRALLGGIGTAAPGEAV